MTVGRGFAVRPKAETRSLAEKAKDLGRLADVYGSTAILRPQIEALAVKALRDEDLSAQAEILPLVKRLVHVPPTR